MIGVGVLAACGETAREDTDSLVRVDAEPPGEFCAQGGVAIHTGLDLDNDGYLEDVEITSTQYACNGDTDVRCSGGLVREGTIIIANEADFAQLLEVTCIDGDLLIAGTDVEEFPVEVANLRIVTGDVVIAGNSKLRTTGGLPLDRVGGTFVIQGNETLMDLEGIGDIDDLFALTIVGNNALPSLRGLEGLINNHASFTVANNVALTSLEGLNNLTTSSRPIAIRANSSLTDIRALGSLRGTHSIEISGHGMLASISLPSLQKVDFRSLYNTNAALQTISLPELASTGDFIQVDNNGALASFDAPKLLTAGGFLVNNDPTLTTLSAPKLVFATGRFELVGLTTLTNVGFASLSSVGGTFWVRGCAALANLVGFEGLETVGGTMFVTNDSALRDFAGLGKLIVVSGDMNVTGNPQLTSYAGLDALVEVGEDLTINTNPMLPIASSTDFANRITVHGKKYIQQ